MGVADEDPTGIRSFLAGGLSGCTFLVVGQPFDTIKVRMQSQLKGAVYRSSLDCLRKTVRQEGVRALYKGMSTPLIACIPYSAVWFLGHDHMIRAQQHLLGRQEMSPMNHGIAGLWAGAYMTFIIAPGERIKCLLQLETNKKKADRQFRGPIDVISKSLRTGGIRQVFKGTLVTAVRDVPGSGLFYVLYAATIQRYGETSYSVMLAGGLGGMAMWLWGVPPDVLKTKFQTAPPGKYKSFLDVAPELYKKEGLGAFFKGFTPSGMRAFLANGVCLVTYDLLMRAWKTYVPVAQSQKLYSTAAVESPY